MRDRRGSSGNHRIADILRTLDESRVKVHVPLCPSLRRDQFAFSNDEPVRSNAVVSGRLVCVRTEHLLLQDTNTITIEDSACSSDDMLTDDEIEQRVARQAVLYEDVIEREISGDGYSAGAFDCLQDVLHTLFSCRC